MTVKEFFESCTNIKNYEVKITDDYDKVISTDMNEIRKESSTKFDIYKMLEIKSWCFSISDNCYFIVAKHR